MTRNAVDLGVSRLTDPDDPVRTKSELAMEARGVPLPLPHRREWTQIDPSTKSSFFATTDYEGRCLFGFAVFEKPSRALPGYRILRLERLGSAGDLPAICAGLSTLAEEAKRRRSVLRVHVEVFARDPTRRSALGQHLQSIGFRRNNHPRCYTETIAIDLRPSDAEIFAALHSTARRHIRAVDKKSLVVRPIHELDAAARMQALLDETMARTGGTARTEDWAQILRLSHAHPHLSRIAGLYRTDVAGPSALVAFAWGCNHGDHVQYSTAASTRSQDLRVPLGYGPAWDLIVWAKHEGASWFDFGGVTRGTARDEGDPLGGISDFKRFFSRDAITVGEEWLLEPRPLQAGLARAISAGTRVVGRLIAR